MFETNLGTGSLFAALNSAIEEVGRVVSAIDTSEKLLARERDLAHSEAVKLVKYRDEFYKKADRVTQLKQTLQEIQIKVGSTPLEVLYVRTLTLVHSTLRSL